MRCLNLKSKLNFEDFEKQKTKENNFSVYYLFFCKVSFYFAVSHAKNQFCSQNLKLGLEGSVNPSTDTL